MEQEGFSASGGSIWGQTLIEAKQARDGSYSGASLIYCIQVQYLSLAQKLKPIVLIERSSSGRYAGLVGC